MPGYHEQIAKLKAHDVGFSEEKLMFAIDAPPLIKTKADVVFLEKGDKNAGWLHVLKHIKEFTSHGIDEKKLITILEDKLKGDPDAVGKTTKGSDQGTLATYVMDAGKGTFTINIIIGNNGFIVGAHPEYVSAAEYYEAFKSHWSMGLGGYSQQDGDRITSS